MCRSGGLRPRSLTICVVTIGLRVGQDFIGDVGVELVQLAVIATAFLLVAQWYRANPWYRQRLVIPASALIAATGVFWTVQRIL